MNRIKNIIFDLGGVLLDLDVHRCLERLEGIGLHEVRQWMTGTNEKGFFKEYECGTLTTEQFRDRIREEVGRELPDEEIDRIWNSMLKEIPDYKFELLLKLKENYNLYLLSNTNDLHWKECAGKFISLNPQLHSRSATYIKRNGLLIRKITIKSSRPFQCAYHPLTP